MRKISNMSTIVNPFFSGINIPDEFFCDRKKETEQVIKWLNNGFNIVLKSPRRLGKSSLIQHILKQDEITNHYNTIYIDIYGTKDLFEFMNEFQKAFLDASFAKTARGKKKLGELFQGLYLQMNLTSDGRPGAFRLGLGPVTNTSLPLQDMFRFLEKTEKTNIVVFDEFQVINEYPEKAAAIIRSHVQQMNNTRFIFAGSARHLLTQMFEYHNEPFYRSATPLDLDIIPQEAYSDFCQDMFSKYGKSIDLEAVHLVYDLLSGNTYDMQEVMKHLFYRTPQKERATIVSVKETINAILDNRETEFREVMSRINKQKDRRTLLCIALEGIATGLTSSHIMKQYGLDNASSVQNALRSLSSDGFRLIQPLGKATYSLENRFLELWLARNNGLLENKFDHAEERFQRERNLTHPA